jgi:hypothetical protein
MDYGDVTKEGGDAILDEGTIDRVMRANYRKIVPCAMQSGARTVELDFVVQPTGRVKAVQVNGQRSGFHAGVHSEPDAVLRVPAVQGQEHHRQLVDVV